MYMQQDLRNLLLIPWAWHCIVAMVMDHTNTLTLMAYTLFADILLTRGRLFVGMRWWVKASKFITSTMMDLVCQ